MSYQHREYREDGTYWASEFKDDATRTVTTYDAKGAVTGTRAYTASENTSADLEAAQAVAGSNEASLREKAGTALETNKQYLAMTSRTQAQVAAQVVVLTRENNALIRLLLQRLDSTDGT